MYNLEILSAIEITETTRRGPGPSPPFLPQAKPPLLETRLVPQRLPFHSEL